MIQALAALANTLIRTLEGLYRFLLELLPHLGRLLFAVSPFVLATATAYILVGQWAAVGVLFLSGLLFIVGLVSANRHGLGAQITPQAFVSVVAVDLVLLATLVYFRPTIIKPQAASSQRETPTSELPAAENVAIQLLDDAFSDRNRSEVIKNLRRLEELKSQHLGERAIAITRFYYQTDHYGGFDATREEIVRLCLEAIIRTKDTSACGLLIEMPSSAYFDSTKKKATDAALAVCGSYKPPRS
jgi:hypothetical protein